MTDDASRYSETCPKNCANSVVANGWFYDIGVFLIALLLLSAAMLFLHALTSGLSGSDEASHFLNAYLIWSYASEALGHNPLSYATDFYIHYPKISIGHWPPLYYVFLSAFFSLLPHAPLPFLIVNLVVGALPVVLIARVVRKAIGFPWALLAGVVYVLIPMSINNTMRLMLDQALAGICLLAALLWSAYSKNPTLRLGLAYAVVAAAAILIKGNGWVLGMFPLLHLALTGRWRLLSNWRTYVAGTVTLLAAGLWTALTYKISSAGFNFAWGIDYFLLAAPMFLSALYTNLGPIGSFAALIGVIGSIGFKVRPELRELGLTGLSMVLATVVFHSLVPVDLDARYMSSAIPFLAIFVAIGLWAIAQRWQFTATRPWMVFPLALVVFSIPGMLFLSDRSPRFDMRMDLVAAQITGQPGGMVMVIDGNSGAEGSFAAEVALRDTGRQSYVVRSSQLLAKSDFMGKKYALTVDTPEAVLGLLDDVSCNAVVVAEGPFIDPRFPHSDLLLAALRHQSSPFRLSQSYPHFRHDGRTQVYLRENPIAPNRDAVKRVNFPEKAPR